MNNSKTIIMDKTEEKYFNALKELHTTLKYTDKLSLTGFVKDNHLAAHFMTVIKKGGIIKVEGKRPNVTYKWNTIPPNVNMAKETAKKVKQYMVDYNESRKPKKKENPVKPLPTYKAFPDRYEGRIGWLKFSFRPVFSAK